MNDPLTEVLSCVTDSRRQQAKRYVLATILLFCIFGFLCEAKSYKTRVMRFEVGTVASLGVRAPEGYFGVCSRT